MLFQWRYFSGCMLSSRRRLEENLAGKGVKLLVLVDHSGEAEKVGFQMRPSRLLIFGNSRPHLLMLSTSHRGARFPAQDSDLGKGLMTESGFPIMKALICTIVMRCRRT